MTVYETKQRVLAGESTGSGVASRRVASVNTDDDRGHATVESRAMRAGMEGKAR